MLCSGGFLFSRFVAFAAALFLMVSSAHARRVALVIGQNAYSALVPLANPRGDARRMAKLLKDHGFEVIACDGKTPGCFDLDRKGFLEALARLEAAGKGRRPGAGILRRPWPGFRARQHPGSHGCRCGLHKRRRHSGGAGRADHGGD